jgi:plastocyanin
MKISAVQKELVSIGAALLALTITATALASEVVTVVQRDRKFQTASVDIAVGDVVQFTNEDPYIHQLYTKSASFSFSSDEQPKGKILSVPFGVAGTFEVRCEIHPKMLLTVNVS